ncbi:MAG: glycine cleavage system protein GcvH [Anaerolineae bacterium]|nr:glycine cleavage system protein GcvH [Anaerolineae bacterium]
MANHVFISYSRKDQAYARKLENELRGRGFEVWIDDRIDYGDRWWRTIVRAIRTSAAFILVMTPDSEESEWVEREVMLTLDEDKPLFPLLLRGKKNPLIGNRRYADVTSGQMPPRDFYGRLRQVLRVLDVSEPVLPKPRREKPPRPAPRTFEEGRRYYTKTDEWVRIQGNEATCGISDHAQTELSDIVFVDLPEVGNHFAQGDPFGVVESVLAASDVYAPLSGRVVAVNEKLYDSPERVNEDPYGKGWLIRITPDDLSELRNLAS